jgi:hypothetical protein
MLLLLGRGHNLIRVGPFGPAFAGFPFVSFSMPTRGTNDRRGLLFAAAIWACGACGLAASAHGQNPFAPAPTTPAPTTPAPTPPATGTPAPAAPSDNPFGTPAPAAPAPAASGANPFGTPAPTTPAPAAPATPAGAPAAAATAPASPAVAPQQPVGNYRKLAAGVETTITSPVLAGDRSSRHDLLEILAESPTFGERPISPGVSPAKGIYFSHDVWGLDFTFKPVRFLRLPVGDGKERLIWYMVYHVRNGGEKPFLFLPHFALESYDVKKTYEEKIIPEVIPLIQKREDKNRKLLSTGEISGEIPPSTEEEDKSVWGVATWEGIDPRTDRFSIFIDGLTNVYKWEDAAGGYQAGDPPGKGRTYHYQVLKLNFWRPSDTRHEHEEEIRFGIPGEVDYEWFYK